MEGGWGSGRSPGQPFSQRQKPICPHTAMEGVSGISPSFRCAFGMLQFHSQGCESFKWLLVRGCTDSCNPPKQLSTSELVLTQHLTQSAAKAAPAPPITPACSHPSPVCQGLLPSSAALAQPRTGVSGQGRGWCWTGQVSEHPEALVPRLRVQMVSRVPQLRAPA